MDKYEGNWPTPMPDEWHNALLISSIIDYNKNINSTGWIT